MPALSVCAHVVWIVSVSVRALRVRALDLWVRAQPGPRAPQSPPPGSLSLPVPVLSGVEHPPERAAVKPLRTAASPVSNRHFTAGQEPVGF